MCKFFTLVIFSQQENKKVTQCSTLRGKKQWKNTKTND